MNWIYKGSEITEIPPQYKGFIGFIYIITVEKTIDDPRTKYIGYKPFLNDDKKILGKREIEQRKESMGGKWRDGIRWYKGKGKKNKGQIIYYHPNKKETWQTYTGSSQSKDMKDKVNNGLLISKEILKFVKNKIDLGYYETKELICNDVLFSDDFYNDCIGGKWYRGKIGEY